MNGTKNPDTNRVTYLDLHSGEFIDAPTQDDCRSLLKMPCWVALMLCPLIGLVYVACTPLVFMGALAYAIGCRCKQKVSPNTLDNGNGNQVCREDRELAGQVIKEIERQFVEKRSLK
jgi:hypothetical protein